MSTENTETKRKGSFPSVEHQFKPGNPGRPKGARGKLGEAFLEAMLEDFTQNGKRAIEKVRTEEPLGYVRVCASILPKELTVSFDPLDDMTDDQLRDYAKRLASELGPLLAFAGVDADALEDQGTARH